jgi:hypothetical protein
MSKVDYFVTGELSQYSMPEPKNGDVVILITEKAPSLAVGELLGWFPPYLDVKDNVIAWAKRVAKESKGRIGVITEGHDK